MRTNDVNSLLERLSKGDKRAAGRLISRVEDNQDRVEIMRHVLPKTGDKMIIGITGPPGAGKSSLVEAITKQYRDRSEKVGIVAVDPSSPYSGGAILGDRIRMNSHGTDPDVFIRSMGTRGHLGGVARSAVDVLRIIEAAGFERLILETVGVGQSELEVMELADTVIVVLNPGTGDGIQAIKAGIMEIADIFVVNKADLPGSDRVRNDVEMMLDMNGMMEWRPPVVLTSTLDYRGLPELIEKIALHQKYLIDSGKTIQRKKEAFRREVFQHWEEVARRHFESVWAELTSKGEIPYENDPYSLSEEIWESILKR